MKIGILGGGQLAYMMLPFIKELGHTSVVLDQAGTSCDGKADQFIQGDFTNPIDCQKLATCDVVTFEIENISYQGLLELSQKTRTYPSHQVLATIQNKGKQKQFFQDHQLPTSEFNITKLLGNESLENKVVKLTTGGYDGKGVWVAGKSSMPQEFINQECLVEEKVDIAKELAIVCSRTTSGQVKTYEMVEMVMDPKFNLLDYQINPAQVPSSLQKEAQELAIKTAHVLNYVGTMAVEFFLDHSGKLWLNEMAPRVHNSGHNTLESAPCSQFENHIRAITEMELGETYPARPSLTLNLLGQGDIGATHVTTSQELEDNIFVHLYNKSESRPGRKMGHVTIIDPDRHEPTIIRNQIIITGKSK